MKRDNLLMVADSEHDADMLYAVGMFLPDPFIYLRLQGRCHIVLPDPEIGRAKKEAPNCRVLPWSRYAKRLQRQGLATPTFAAVIKEILREKGLKKLLVPSAFPMGLGRELRQLKVKIKVEDGPFFTDRQFKTPDEIRKINAALTMAEVGLAEGIQALRNSKPGKRRQLLYHGVPLTSEKLRAIIDTAILQSGGRPSRTIVAGGRQSTDPHEPGHGPLRANEPVVIDVFPRSQKTGYFGDITRTVVKGRASEDTRRLYETVKRAQQLAFNRVLAGAKGASIHASVAEFFAEEGYPTKRQNGTWQGFFHGTGHGVGLQLHEAPRIGPSSGDTLRAGHVVTLEPGLYYSELGGIRLEDVILVTADRPKNLTKFEKVLEV